MASKILITGGTVYDGVGSPGKKLDVLIEDDRIKAMAEPPGAGVDLNDPELTVIDAAEKIVCPGFIDMHAHSDFKTPVDGSMAPKLRQGFTTVVMGACGFSGAPVNDLLRRDFRGYLTGMFGNECPFDWSTMGEYLEYIKRRGIGANVYPQAGFGNLRQMTIGHRPLKAGRVQIEKMKSLLAQALDEGARGFSTGLVYPMQCFSSHEEVRELCAVAAKRGAIYSTHVRNEMDRVEPAMKEAIDLGRETGVSVQISHHKAVARRNWGKPRKTLEMIERARADGIDVETDVYPYTAFSNVLLFSLLINEPDLGDRIIFLELKNLPRYEGKTLADVMRDTGRSARGARLFVLRREGFTKAPIAGEFISEDDLRYILAHPLVSIGSDGVEPQEGKKAHPRLFSTTVRFLRHYVMEQKLVTMEEAIRKMTSMPAAKAKIRQRGLLKEGYFADVAVFDPRRLRDNSTYADPMKYPDGFDAVIVNGKIAVRGDEQTGERAGRIL